MVFVVQVMEPSILTLLADSQHMTNTYRCEYSVETPDDGQ
jgi:hypothetical protein